MVQRSCGLAFNVLLLGSCIILRLPLSLLVEPLLRSIAYDYFIFMVCRFSDGMRSVVAAGGQGSWNSFVHHHNHNRCHVAITIGATWPPYGTYIAVL